MYELKYDQMNRMFIYIINFSIVKSLSRIINYVKNIYYFEFIFITLSQCPLELRLNLNS